tara:strand:- start:3194 stop:4339 length:1146 start_codon:yes stop_codon:yes gene_type:complete
MPDFNPQKLTDTLAGAPSLDILSTRRVEFAQAPRVWSDVLRPELARREIERKAAIRQAITRTIIGASLPIFIAALLAISTLVLVDFMFPTIIFIVFVCAAIVSATAWVKVFTMKSQTKQLVLTAACEPFGFTYDTLHPDFSGIEDLKSLAARAGEISTSYAGKPNSTHKTPFGVISVGSMEGAPAPTPAYDILKTAKLLPGHSRRKFEDLIAGERAGTQFALVEAKLDTGGKNSTTVFQGILVHVEYPERFFGRTVMARSRWWKRGKHSSDLKKVDLISRELEEAFTVYSTDQVEARALLSPDRMERLIALERHFSGGKLRGIFEDGHMTLVLEAENQFEAGSIFKPLVDPRRYASALVELGLVCDLIDGFLTRDWVKGRL